MKNLYFTYLIKSFIGHSIYFFEVNFFIKLIILLVFIFILIFLLIHHFLKIHIKNFNLNNTFIFFYNNLYFPK